MKWLFPVFYWAELHESAGISCTISGPPSKNSMRIIRMAHLGFLSVMSYIDRFAEGLVA